MSRAEAHILLVDDNQDILKMLTTMLSIKKYKVTATDRPLELEDCIRASTPDLVLMDMLMSGCDGRDICRSLKANSEFSHLPVVMISAHPHARKDCLTAGADEFIEKPFEMTSFFEVIAKLLV